MVVNRLGCFSFEREIGESATSTNGVMVLFRPLKIGNNVSFFGGSEGALPCFADRRRKHKTAITASTMVRGTTVPIVAPIMTELLI